MNKLVAAAVAARERARAPYSKFKVGAALEASDGRIFAGCNVENASLGLTMCAERVALFKAVSEGAEGFRAAAVATEAAALTPPCGACRQLLWELCGDIPITMANTRGESETVQLKDLLPRAFDRRNLA